MPLVSQLPQQSPATVEALRLVVGMPDVEAGVTSAQTAADNADAKATAAQSAAAAADDKAVAAQEAADAAQSTAANAAGVASAANNAADAAQTAASNAEAAAATALSTAQAAQTTADGLADDVAAALSAANTATGAVDTLSTQLAEINQYLDLVNRIPTASAIVVNIDEDVINHQGSVFDNVDDADGDVLEVTEVKYLTNTYAPGQAFNTVFGSMVVTKAGLYTFTPNSTALALNDGETGTVSFSFSVRDEHGATVAVPMSVTVNGISPEEPEEPGEGGTFDDLYDPGFQLITNQNYYARPTQAKPAKMTNQSTPGYTDSVFGTKIFGLTRVNDTSDTLTDLRHVYSRQTAINADNTLAIARASNGWWHMFSLVNGQRIMGDRVLTPGYGALVDFINECECFWHPTNPKKLWRTGNQGAGCAWYEYDVDTKQTTLLFDLNPLLQAMGAPWTNAGRAWFKGEGRPSNDGRYFAMQVETSGYSMIGLIMYDRVAHQIVGSLVTTNRPDHISTSPLGNYAVPSWYGTAEPMATAATRPVNQASGARAYSRDFSTFTQLSVLGEHSDLALDAQGNEVFVSVSFRGGEAGNEPDVPDGGLYYRRLSDGVAYHLPGSGYGQASDAGVHISGLATSKPGWAIVSWYGGTPTTWKDGVIYAVELVPENPIVKRLCHHQCVYGGNYINEPHAVPSHDLSMVLFASNFGSGPAEDYFVALPSNAFPPAGSGRPPVNQSAPQVTGTVTPGSVLTCAPGDWSGTGISFTYQWYRAGIVVSGANNNTYTIPGGEAAGTQYYCRVRGTNTVDYAEADSNIITIQVPSAPQNTVAPSITGGSAEGSLLTAVNGTWTGLPTPTFAYQWYKYVASVWEIIPDETNQTYLAEEIGDYRVRVTASNTQGSDFADSGTKSIVGAAPPKTAIATPYGANNTWQNGGTATVAGVQIGESVVFVLHIDEGSGDGAPNSITSTVLGVPLTLKYASPAIAYGGRQLRQYLYVADQVTQAGDATITWTLAADSHFSWQARRFTGGVGNVDVQSPASNNAGFSSPHAIPTMAATIANAVDLLILTGATDMSNANLALPAGYTSMGADQVGPLVGISGYRVRTATGNVGGNFTSQAGGYGSAWMGIGIALY